MPFCFDICSELFMWQVSETQFFGVVFVGVLFVQVLAQTLNVQIKELMACVINII